MLDRIAALTPALLVFALAGASEAQQLKSTLVASGLAEPVGLTSPPGETQRLFVLERAGRIRIVKNGVLLPTPFLDLTAFVSTPPDGGLLGLAFHPDYTNNGRFFVSCSERVNSYPVVREYAVSSNPDVAASPANGVSIFGPHPHAPFHYASDLHFGLDGKLFYTLGHGDGTPQDLSIYDGKVLRMDVDAAAPYAPVDNPYPSSGGAPALTWALGLRNPFRFAFDRLTGDLYLGDVGSILHEELDFQPASHGAPGSQGYMGGRNYGFPCVEGDDCTGTPLCATACPPPTGTFTAPAYAYRHNGAGAAIIGGYVYRGSAIASYQGRYFFADYVTNAVWSVVVSGGVATSLADHTLDLRGTPQDPHFSAISSFGEDAAGELYVTCFSSGEVYRIDPALPLCAAPFNYCVTSPNVAGSGAVIGSTGSASIAAAELVLTVRHCPPNRPGLFFLGTSQAFLPFGNGVLCVSGHVVRAPVVFCDDFGNANQPFHFTAFALAPGATRTFQFYYRDAVGSSGLGFNLSDARSVSFCP